MKDEKYLKNNNMIEYFVKSLIHTLTIDNPL